MENKRKKETDSLTAVRHYVKNPFYVLKGYLDSLFSDDLGVLNEKQKKYVSICLDNVDKANVIVDRLFSVVEIEDGKYHVAKEETDIVQVVDEAVEDNAFLAGASNTKMFFKKGEESLFVLTDSYKIKNVVNSLLSNAVKYKHSGEGAVEIIIEKKEEKAFCSVKDNGIGISEDEKKEIFNKFYRGKEAIEIDPNSLGLDLFISKAVIEKSGGEIWAEKNENKGVTFYFTLPLS